MLNTIAFLAWFALLMFLSTVWRDRVDSSCIVFTQWVEDVMLGKKTVLGSLNGIQEKLVGANGTTTMGNGYKGKEMESWKESKV